MAFADDIRSFMENRLQAFDPTIDLSANSNAQQTIIDPLISKLGEDPFSVDVSLFLRDRLVQEFPELAADNAGLLEDLFTKPLQLVLEPFKRSIQSSQINLSVANASLMADDEADALGGNFFEDREDGDFASGPARIFFSAPTTVRITTDRQVTAKNGLAFFPTDNTFITSQQMLFNREGDLFFVDITIRAQDQGTDFNIDEDSLISIDNVDGVVRITNKSPFTSGLPRETNEEYLGRIPQALTERSLVTKRGVNTRVPDTFGSGVRAVQVVGAGEEGMDRDVLRGTGEGFLHLVGNCSFFGSWVFIGSVIYKDDGIDNDITIQPGDNIRLILQFSDDPARTVYDAVVSQIISNDIGGSTEKYILILDRTIDTLIGTIGDNAVISVFKAGFITIAGIPGGIAADITVADDSVHLGGHSDVFIRPSADSLQVGVVSNLTDGDPIFSAQDLGVIFGDNVAFHSFSTDFVALGVRPGDILVIETGASAGSYRIISVGPPDVVSSFRVDTIFTVAEFVRARITRRITIDLVEPKVPKIPFNQGPASDLQNTVGSTLFRLTSTNVQSFGVEIGDTIRILDGLNAGDYTIIGFDLILGGQGPIVNRSSPATAANQRYEIFTVSAGLAFPLVRIRSIELLDSTNQGTGITIPYGDAVDVRATCDLEGAGKKIRVLDRQLIVFADASSLWGLDGLSLTQVFANTTSGTSDARYGLGLEIADGRVRVATSGGPPDVPIDQTEINLPPFLYNGRRDTLLALTTRADPSFNVPLPLGGEHRTSDLAESKIGDSLVILDGPNKGNYIIKDIRVLRMWAKTGTAGHQKIALIRVDQELPVDPMKTIIDFIAAAGVTSAITATELASGIEDATIFFSSTFWVTDIIDRLRLTLVGQGFSITAPQVESLVMDLCTSGYEVGPSAHGTFRVLFQEPVTADFFFGDRPTLFQAIQNEALRYRVALDLEPAQILPDAQEATPPTEWNRDLALNQADNTEGFLTSGSAFVQRGVRDGDIIEFHQAINDLPARKNMTSSWLFVTTAGQNLITAIFSGGINSTRPDNLTNLDSGQLFFIDSGPDIGAYMVTEVVESNFGADPPSIQFKIDRALTHSTQLYPVGGNRDFKSHVNAVLSTTGNVFPMTLVGLNLVIEFKSFNTGPTTFTHTFGAGPFNTITDVVNDIVADGAFTTKFSPFANGNELVLRSLLINVPRESLKIKTGTNSIGAGKLGYTLNQLDGGYLGGVAVPGTKRIFGTGFAGFTANQWISVYAANNSTILSQGEDASYVGTYKVISAGTQVGGSRNGFLFIELDRSINFTSETEIRWIRHSAPDIVPSETTNGGKTLSTDYVRGRLYDEAVLRATITIPWGATINPILSSSEEQISLSVTPVLLINFAHKIPYRIIRDGVIHISSTRMADNRQGALYFVDVPIIGIGTNEELNIDETVGLSLDGNREIAGYTLSVDNELLAFSTKEQVSLILPSSILPVGSTPDTDNEVKLAGQSIQINYDNAPLIANIQQFFDSPLDRVICANILVRHFLPSYVFLDAVYTGGDDESIIAVDLIKYINTIDPDLNELSSDEVSKIIHRHSVTKVKQPINLIVLTHGSDRRIRGTQSTDVIGGANLPTFKGNFKQTYFISGPDTSTDNPRPSGEQVFLVRL